MVTELPTFSCFIQCHGTWTRVPEAVGVGVVVKTRCEYSYCFEDGYTKYTLDFCQEKTVGWKYIDAKFKQRLFVKLTSVCLYLSTFYLLCSLALFAHKTQRVFKC